MRILVLGAGGVGGYFGGRLLEKGEDVTFLVRPGRKKQLEQDGLVIRSVHGDLQLQPKLVTAADGPAGLAGTVGAKASGYDLILFSTKAYHLPSAVQDLQPFVGERTVILPLLNGVAHISLLQAEFGADKVIGGLCFIETTLNSEGHIVQTSKDHYVRFGEFAGKDTDRIRTIAAALAGTKAAFELSPNIELDIWRKYLFISVIAGVTSLTRAPIGPIRASAGGSRFIRDCFAEMAAVVRAEGAPLDEDIVDKHMRTMEKLADGMKSSMQRDMEKGLSTEAAHLHGYLLELAAKHGLEAPLLRAIYQNLLVYEQTGQL